MTAVAPHVLVVSREMQNRRLLRRTLSVHGYRVVEANSGKDGLRHAEAKDPDVVLVDLELPEMDGFEFTRRLRRASAVPILALSYHDDELTIVRALDNGADDFLTKPFGSGELGARIRVALRRANRTPEAPSATILVGERIQVDLARRVVVVAGKEVHLTPIEYKLLETLIRSADKVLTHQYLLELVWGPEFIDQTQYLRVYMKALRTKLEKNPTNPKHLVTELGVGYRLRLS
jgi:two-component system KDP operon response regulator KdpE